MRKEAPRKPRPAPKSHRGTQPRKPTICPPFATQFQKYFCFCPFWSPKFPRKHQRPSKNVLLLPLFSLFCPHAGLSRCSHSPELPRCCQSIGNGSPQGKRERNKRKSRSKWGTREREGKEAERQQAHKPTKRGYPPLLQGAGSPSPHHKFAPKNQQKVALGRFEKIFGKIFRGNVSGQRKTPRVSQRKGF